MAASTRVKLILAANLDDADAHIAARPQLTGRVVITPHTLDRLKGLRVDPAVSATKALRLNRPALLKVVDAVRPCVVRR